MLRIVLSSLLVLGAVAAPVAQDEESILSTIISDVVPEAKLPAYAIQVEGDGIAKNTYLHLAEADGKSYLQLKGASSATSFIFDHATQHLSVSLGGSIIASERDLYAETTAPLEFKSTDDLNNCLNINRCQYDIWSVDTLTGAVGVVRQTHPNLYACGDEGDQTIWTGPAKDMKEGCVEVSLNMVV